MKMVRMTKLEASIVCSTIDVVQKLAKKEHLLLDPADAETLRAVRERLAKKFNVNVRVPVLGAPPEL